MRIRGPANAEQAAPWAGSVNSSVRYTAEQLVSENRPLPRLITRSSDIHAAGCFALEDIPKGTVVLEYTGERITKEEGDVRYDGRPFTYLFGIGDGAVVIGTDQSMLSIDLAPYHRSLIFGAREGHHDVGERGARAFYRMLPE